MTPFRPLLLLFLLAVCSLAVGKQASHGAGYYDALLKTQAQLASKEAENGESAENGENGKRLWAFIVEAWPDRGERGYVPSSYVRAPEERRAFLQALQRLLAVRLLAAGNPTPGSDAYKAASFELFFASTMRQPLAHRALLLSLDGLLDESDIWQLVALRVQTSSSQALFADIEYLFSDSETRWTPAARAVFDLANQGSPTILGIQRLLARYQQEANFQTEQETTINAIRLALPIRGLYAEPVEHLLALIEGTHLWRARGRDDLAKEALTGVRKLEVSLSKQLGQDISRPVEEALAAPVRYVPQMQVLPKVVYWPVEGARSANLDSKGNGRKEEASPPMTLRWVRSGESGESAVKLDSMPMTRRIGSNDVRWWPASQEAYLDLAYRAFPELLRRQLAAAGRLEIFRVWHAGSEDGSQTFLLAALVDEALAILAADPGLAELADELRQLRIEIIATDYAYLPDRQGLTYRFDTSGTIGNMHHKWNLIAEESATVFLPGENRIRANTGFGDDGKSQAAEPQRLVGLLESSSTRHERGRVLRRLADDGRAGELLGRFFKLAPEVDVPSGDWLQEHPGGAAKYRYRMTNDRWRVVELREGVRPEVVIPGTGSRLIRFEKGDMTQHLPSGFEGGDAFNISVVTNVLPYIYAYYSQQGGRSLQKNEGKNVRGVRLTPMEEAQKNLVYGSRQGAWILMDWYTERDALAARDERQNWDPNYKNWSSSWIRWVRSLPEKQIELHLTREYGVEHCPSKGYRG